MTKVLVELERDAAEAFVAGYEAAADHLREKLRAALQADPVEQRVEYRHVLRGSDERPDDFRSIQQRRSVSSSPWEDVEDA